MITLYLIFLGACLGSFTSALVWRIHEQAKLSHKSKLAKVVNLSIVSGRSVCPNCNHILAPIDLVPILSWLQLRGRCRYCKMMFDDTPFTEVVLPALFVLSYYYWPVSWSPAQVVLFCLWLVFLTGFMALSVYDLRWYLLPNRVVYPLLVMAFVNVGLRAWVAESPVHTLLMALSGLAVGGGVFYLLFQYSNGKWIGGGDVKLGFMLGILVGGPLEALLVIFIASCLGTFVSIPMLISGKYSKNKRIPFGPFLIASGIIVYIFGASIINWYTHQLNIY